jgi:hypothetical protein
MSYDCIPPHFSERYYHGIPASTGNYRRWLACGGTSRLAVKLRLPSIQLLKLDAKQHVALLAAL